MCVGVFHAMPLLIFWRTVDVTSNVAHCTVIHSKKNKREQIMRVVLVGWVYELRTVGHDVLTLSSFIFVQSKLKKGC